MRFTLRGATAFDAEPIANVFSASFRLLTFLPMLHTVEEDRRSIQDSWSIRNSALQNRITYYTTLSGAKAACLGMQHLQEMRPYDIQSLHAQLSP